MQNSSRLAARSVIGAALTVLHKGARHCFAELWISGILARGEIESLGIRGKIRICRSPFCPPLNPSADAIA